MTSLHYSVSHPAASEFMTLRNSAGWGDIELTTAETALCNSLCTVTARTEAGMLIGIARAIGDGALNVYIQDVIIASDFRAAGVGSEIMRRLIDAIKRIASPDCTIGLMAAEGQDPFYEILGFTKRPTQGYGAGFTARLQALAKTPLRA